MTDDAHDPILNQTRRVQLFNGYHDCIKIISHSDFLNSYNPILGLDYEAFARGCYPGVFPSCYGPWNTLWRNVHLYLLRWLLTFIVSAASSSHLIANSDPSSFFPFIRSITPLQHATLLRLLLYPGNVLLRDGVPGGHVLLHAGCEAGFFAFGEGGTGLGDAALEAVLVEFLEVQWSDPGRHIVGVHGGVLGGDVLLVGRMDAYLDESACVGEGGLLADLVHELGFGVGHFCWWSLEGGLRERLID